MKVKICGLQEKTNVEVAIQSGADYIGFVFAPSKRRISIQQAKELAKIIPSNVKKVGVFVNPTYDEVMNIYNEVPLDIVQFHGNETVPFISQFSFPIVKAFKVMDGDIPKVVTDYTCPVLLDAPSDVFEGGSGKAFDWEKASNVKIAQPLIIAGGLTSSNVQDAINLFHPFAVDVSSGVETNGRKDNKKIIEFIASAKGDF